MIFNGFAFICHQNRDKKELLYEISQFRLNKQELIELHRGGSASHFVKLSEWEDESSNYFNRFFSKSK